MGFKMNMGKIKLRITGVTLGSLLLTGILITNQNCGKVNFNAITASSVGTAQAVGVNATISKIKPALVSRATGCIMCHGKVGSNIITDFGYGGDGHGSNYFFGGVPGQSLPSGLSNTKGESIYGDYDFTTNGDQNWGSASLAAGISVVVPVAPTAGLQVQQDSLANYLRYILSQNPNAHDVNVLEIPSLYIGAPTTQKIKAASGVSAGGIKYIPAAGAAGFSGIAISGANTFYTNSPSTPIVCDGDLVVDGILWLNQPNIQTTNGCRIYSTSSVFVTGPITYSGQSANRNLQITSSKMVALGIGRDSCHTNAQYGDSIAERFTWTTDSRWKGFFTRTLGDPQSMLAGLMNDANTVGNLSDALCGTGGRAVNMERLLVNAPIVQSRYQGQYKGMIIGEITLLSLEALDYIFDPVFLSVPILPLLDPSDYLSASF